MQPIVWDKSSEAPTAPASVASTPLRPPTVPRKTAALKSKKLATATSSWTPARLSATMPKSQFPLMSSLNLDNKPSPSASSASGSSHPSESSMSNPILDNKIQIDYQFDYYRALGVQLHVTDSIMRAYQTRHNLFSSTCTIAKSK
jgi:hypothetical protein